MNMRRTAPHILGVLALALVSVFGVATPSFAQTGTPTGSQAITQTATMLNAATRCDSVAGSGAQTLTLQNPGPGASDYITFVIAYGEATGTVSAAAPIAITTTGINGTAPTLGSVNLTAWTIGAVTGPGPIPIQQPIKANANTAPTIAIASVTNLSWRITACYYQAP